MANTKTPALEEATISLEAALYKWREQATDCEVAELIDDGLTAITEANTERTELLDALERAQGFIQGFEDDESQEGIAELLATIRAAIAKG